MTEKTIADIATMERLMAAAANGEVIKEETDALRKEEEVKEEKEVGGNSASPEALAATGVTAPETEELPSKDATKQDSQNKPDSERDNAENSRLGRKVAALWTRFDEMKPVMDKVAEALEKLHTAPPKQEQDEDHFITLAQAKQITDAQVKEAIKAREQADLSYQKNYASTIISLGTELEDAEYEGIVKEMESNWNKRYSDDPVADAQRNFYSAERVFLRRQLAVKPAAEKKIPKGDLPSGAKIATAQAAEKVKVKDNPLPRLDAAAQAYLDYVERMDGKDKALALHRKLAERM
jgi:hypothetical protein